MMLYIDIKALVFLIKCTASQQFTMSFRPTFQYGMYKIGISKVLTNEQHPLIFIVLIEIIKLRHLWIIFYLALATNLLDMYLFIFFLT